MSESVSGPAGRLRHWATYIVRKLGIDRAVWWTLLTQGTRFVTGPITMFLMVHYLTPETQGYAYTFASVTALSIFLEMGFSQNILQFASHEFSKLHLDRSRALHGDSVALSRLISLGRLSFQYYTIAALLFFSLMLTGGIWFFQSSPDVGVSWRGPWILACTTSALSLAVNPCWALIEGCNQIAILERFRFYNSVGAFVLSAICLASGFELYAIVVPAFLSLLISLSYLVAAWRHFFEGFRNRPTAGVISWKREIWPFQWRIAVSWMSGYFIFSFITPVIFRLVSPAEAGRFGFTLQLVRTIATIASSWTVTKLPLFGMLVARKEWTQLNAVWSRVTKTTLVVALLGSVGMMAAMELASHFYPRLADRYSGPAIAALLCGSMVCQCLISSCAYFLRAFKVEPYMKLSVTTALLSALLIPLFAYHWRVPGATMGYVLAVFATAVPAYVIFKSHRKNFTAR